MPYLLQIGEENAVLQSVIDNLDDIKFKDENTQIDMDLDAWFDGIDTSKYYSYAGSLTTPG